MVSILYQGIRVVFLLQTLYFLVKSQGNSCNSATDCKSCIQAGSQCDWCLEANFTLGENFGKKRARCDLAEKFLGTCNKTTADIKTTTPEPAQTDQFGDSVQVKPQEIKLELRSGQPTNFKVSVKPAENFPVDLYFLMDVSASLKDDLIKLQTLGRQLATEIQKITTNYRFAFGSFCDKTLIPYIQPLNHDNLFPCSHSSLKNINCRPTFGYIHFFDFNNDTTAFENVVAAQNITGDLDSPEGGFDGLMQAAVCGQVLKWKEKRQARRIVIFVTDHFPKIAGDAKLAGLITPNDGQCHMSSVSINSTEKVYDATRTMDYPSIHHLKKVMHENEIVPILAIANRAFKMYQAIANEWKDLGAAIGELTDDSSNIVQLVQENYAKISSTVRLVDTSPEYIKVEYKLNASSCPTADLTRPNECSNVKIAQQVDFNVTVELLSCPPDASKAPQNISHFSFSIRIAGFGEIIVPVKYLCDCSCANANEKNSPLCSDTGTFECGICKCNKGRYGATCQCDQTTNNLNDTNDCIASDNSTCSNEGICVCGKCECFKGNDPNQVISGPVCECKNFGCPNNCEGGTRGECVCGKCVCKPEYQGPGCGEENCDYIEKTKCTIDGKVCNDQGTCLCKSQRCQCNLGYDGTYCQNCQTETCKCNALQNCVLCKVFDQKNLNCSACDTLDIVEVEDINKTVIGDKLCQTLLSTCLVNFHLSLDPENKTIFVQKTPECPGGSSSNDDEDEDILAIVFGIIGAILLLGLLLLLLWKLITMLHDRKDYEKFQKSKQKGVWEKGDNPLYRKPNQQFANPAFAGGQ